MTEVELSVAVTVLLSLLPDGLTVPLPPSPFRILASFISGLFNFYEDLYFTYLEINPLGNWLCWGGMVYRPSIGGSQGLQ